MVNVRNIVLGKGSSVSRGPAVRVQHVQVLQEAQHGWGQVVSEAGEKSQIFRSLLGHVKEFRAYALGLRSCCQGCNKGAACGEDLH